MQTSDQLWFTERLKFKPNCAGKTTALLQQFADCMEVDLKPDYFKDKLNLAGAHFNVSKNVLRDKSSVMRLEENEKGGYSLAHYVEWQKQKETVFDKNGQRVFSIGVDNQADTKKEAFKAVTKQAPHQVKAETSLKKTLSQTAPKKKANQATNVQGFIKNQGR